jgi:acyl carrier protein
MDDRVATVLSSAWCEVLGLEEVTPDLNFFALGGNSLSAIRLVERVESELGIEIALEVLFMGEDFTALLEHCELQYTESRAQR